MPEAERSPARRGDTPARPAASARPPPNLPLDFRLRLFKIYSVEVAEHRLATPTNFPGRPARPGGEPHPQNPTREDTTCTTR